MLEQLISLLTLTTLTMASYGLGRPMLRGLGFKFEDVLETAVWSVAVGIIVAGTFLTFMGLLGLLYVPAIGVLTLAAGFWGVGELVNGYLRHCETAYHRADAQTTSQTMPSRWQTVPSGLAAGVAVLTIVACIGSLVGAMAPPTAGDAMCYHLALPKTFLENGSICYLQFQDRATFPLLVQMWYLWAMAIDSPTAAALVHWGLGLLLAMSATLLARPIIGRGWAWLAGCLVLLVPGINNQMAAPLNDVALAALTTLSLTAWWKGAVENEGRRWFLLAGLAAGAAASTKYIAVIFAIAMAATWAWKYCFPTLKRFFYFQYPTDRHVSEKRRTIIVGAAVVASLTVAISGVWYVRAAWYRGNPVYPFLCELQTDPGAAEGFETLPKSKSPLSRTPWNLAAAAWHLTMSPEDYGGRGHQLGAIWLAALPGLFFARRLRGLGTLLAVAATYAVVWFLLRQNERFLYPIIPLLCIALVWVWMEMRRLPHLPRTIAIAAQAAILIASASASCTRQYDKLPVALGLESRDKYLLRSEPTYAIAQHYARDNLKPGDRILSQDYREFYFDMPVVWEKIYRRVTHYDQSPNSSDGIGLVLRRDGFSHLLLVENASEQGMQFEPTLSQLTKADPNIRKSMICTHYEDQDGGRRTYRLVALPQLPKQR